MESDIIGRLEERITELLASYAGLKHENSQLREENRRLIETRESISVRIDALLVKLEGLRHT